jgi:hypothetical protein
MDIKVLFARGEGVYIVQKDNLFYLVNLKTNNKPFVSEFVDSFLKFGYFTEVGEIDKKELFLIKAKLT